MNRKLVDRVRREAGKSPAGKLCVDEVIGALERAQLDVVERMKQHRARLALGHVLCECRQCETLTLAALRIEHAACWFEDAFRTLGEIERETYIAATYRPASDGPLELTADPEVG